MFGSNARKHSQQIRLAVEEEEGPEGVMERFHLHDEYSTLVVRPRRRMKYLDSPKAPPSGSLSAISRADRLHCVAGLRDLHTGQDRVIQIPIDDAVDSDRLMQSGHNRHGGIDARGVTVA